MKKIAIIASGGDAPGMNAAIRAVVRTAISRSTEVVGLWDGYDGLIDMRVQRLDSPAVAGILGKGGSVIGAGRSPRFLEPDVRSEAVAKALDAGIEGLIVIGGEGSMTGAQLLHEQGLKTVVVPGTIDNDMPGTDITIGADTAINTAVDAIDRLRDTASAHRRAMLVEVMGRHCGYIAVQAGLAAGAELILTPERPYEFDQVISEIKANYDRGKRHFIAVVAEGATWRAGELAKMINDSPTPYDARDTVLGYVQRGGVPTQFDRVLATRMGVAAADALLHGHSGVMTAWRDNEIRVRPIEDLEPRPDPWLQDFDRAHLLTTL